MYNINVMAKLLGLLPYIYFFDEPVQIGPVKFIGVPDWQGRNHAPSESIDREYLQELMKCFPVSRGLKSDKGGIRALTYFLLDNEDMSDNQANARKATTLLRYMMLRPDFQALEDIETSTIYTLELPPVGEEKYRTYHCWVNFNQEEWVTPVHQKFHPPGWYVDFKMMSSNDLEGLDEIKNQFYEGCLNSKLEADILLAMEWYNLSFQKYSMRSIAGHLVDIATAFETLFQLPRNNKTREFKNRIRESLGTEEGSVLDEWAASFYSDVRSETVHTGKPSSYLFKHPSAQTPHLSFLWSAQKIFRECVAFKLGIERKISNERLVEELTPNEVLLKELRALGSFKKIKDSGALFKVWKLRRVYPVGERNNIVWLGKTLLGEMAKKPETKKLENLSAVVESILNAKDDDEMLGWEYHKLFEQLKGIFNQDADKGLKDLAKAFDLYLISSFAEFAGYALTMLYYSQKQREKRV